MELGGGETADQITAAPTFVWLLKEVGSELQGCVQVLQTSERVQVIKLWNNGAHPTEIYTLITSNLCT